MFVIIFPMFLLQQYSFILFGYFYSSKNAKLHKQEGGSDYLWRLKFNNEVNICFKD